MGYRLEISEAKYAACGNKLYGYINENDLKDLKSYKYLLSKEYITGEEYWGYGFDNKIILTSDEFKEFIKLYNEDYKRYKGGLDLIDEKIQKLIESTADKILEWM